MAPAAAQRRAKRQSQETTAEVKTAAAASNDVAPAPGSLAEQINRAEKAVTSNYAHTLTLHSQWRTYLMRLSYLVVVLAFHQTQGPMTACLKDLKAAGTAGPDAIKELLRFSLSDILGIVLAGLMALFLTKKVERSDPDEFSDILFLVGNVLPVPIMGLRGMQDNAAGCIDHTSVSLDDGQIRKRSFPISLVFNVIATLCYMFMQSQLKQHRENVLMVQKLRKDLEDAQSAGKTSGGDKKSE